MNITIKTVKCSVDFLFLSIVAFVLLCDKTSYACWSFFAIIIHEIGHFMAMRIVKTTPSAVKISFCGVGVCHSFCKISHKKELFILLAGPLLNLLIFAFTSPFQAWCPDLFFKLSLPHLAVGFFNFLPMSVTDGGRALQIILRLKCSTLKRADDLFFGISLLFLSLCIIYSIYLFIVSGYNFSMLATTLYLTAMLLNPVYSSQANR